MFSFFSLLHLDSETKRNETCLFIAPFSFLFSLLKFSILNFLKNLSTCWRLLLKVRPIGWLVKLDTQKIFSLRNVTTPVNEILDQKYARFTHFGKYGYEYLFQRVKLPSYWMVRVKYSWTRVTTYSGRDLPTTFSRNLITIHKGSSSKVRHLLTI